MGVDFTSCMLLHAAAAAAAAVLLQELLRLPAGRLELDGWPQYHGRLRLDGVGRCQVRAVACCSAPAALGIVDRPCACSVCKLVCEHSHGVHVSSHAHPCRLPPGQMASDRDVVLMCALCRCLQVHLNMFQYFMFWAAFYVLRGSSSSSSSDKTG